MADLKTTYEDDILNTSKNTKRKYNMITNPDGTVSFEDVTDYSQEGDSFGAADVNAITKAINALNSDLRIDLLINRIHADNATEYTIDSDLKLSDYNLLIFDTARFGSAANSIVVSPKYNWYTGVTVSCAYPADTTKYVNYEYVSDTTLKIQTSGDNINAFVYGIKIK